MSALDDLLKYLSFEKVEDMDAMLNVNDLPLAVIAAKAEYASILARLETAERRGVEDCGDREENTTDNPKSWVAWKRRAETAEKARDEARKIIEHATNIETGIRSGTQVTVHYTRKLEEEAETWLAANPEVKE